MEVVNEKENIDSQVSLESNQVSQEAEVEAESNEIITKYTRPPAFHKSDQLSRSNFQTNNFSNKKNFWRTAWRGWGKK